MKLSKYLRDVISVAFIGAGLSGAYFVSKTLTVPPMQITKQQSSLNLDTDFLKYFNLGQKRLYSSLFWIATILESDHDHYKGKNLNSWMYLRFLTISNLEPKFLPTYTFGGPYLSIIKDDLEGASMIYDKGLSLYPDDYNLLSNAAFHYQFEKIDHDKSYKLYEKLSTSPKATVNQISSLARLKANDGNLETAYELLQNLYSQQPDSNSFLSKKIWGFLYALKAENDLKCLNNKNRNCNLKDLDNDFYIHENDIYRAKKVWTPYRWR
jgi:hypothetical protein